MSCKASENCSCSDVFYAKRKFVGELNELSSFQVITWLENEKILLFWEEKRSVLSKYEVIRAHRIWDPVGFRWCVGICIILEERTKSFGQFWKFHIKASVFRDLHWPTVDREQGGETTCLCPAKKHGVSFHQASVRQKVTRTSHITTWCLTSRYLFVRRFSSDQSFNICLCKNENLTGNTCENICIWPNICSKYIGNLGTWIFYGLKKL